MLTARTSLKRPRDESPFAPFPSEYALSRYKSVYELSGGTIYGPIMTFICTFGKRVFYLFGDEHVDTPDRKSCNEGKNITIQGLLAAAFSAIDEPHRADFIFELLYAIKWEGRSFGTPTLMEKFPKPAKTTHEIRRFRAAKGKWPFKNIPPLGEEPREVFAPGY